MSLNAQTLAAEISEKLVAQGFNATEQNRKLWLAVAEAVIEHLQQNAGLEGLVETGPGAGGKVNGKIV